MAITREKVQRAVANFLPSSISVSQDSTTNSVDPEKVFEKLQTLVAAAIVTDPNAIYYLVSLSLAELTAAVSGVIGTIVELSSQEILLSAERGASSTTANAQDLQQALSALSGLSTDSSTDSFNSFDTAVSAFQTNTLNEITKKRNLELIDQDIAASALSLSQSLTDIRALIDRAESALTSIEESDLKKLAITKVAAAVSVRVAQIKAEVESGEEYSDKAEAYLVDLVAAKAVLRIISSAVDFRGTTVVAPKTGAQTLQTYLALQGSAELTPRQYVAKGPSGKPFLDYIYASRGGASTAAIIDLTAFLSSSADLVFPLSLSTGTLSIDVNGQAEAVNFGGTFVDINDLVTGYNSAATKTTAKAVGDRLQIHAYAADTDPVGKSSSIELLSAPDGLSTGLKILAGERSVGSLVGKVLSDSIVTLSDYTFPSSTVTSGSISLTQFDCYVLPLSGVSQRIDAIDTAANTITLSPGIPLVRKVAADGSVSYSVENLSYLVLRTSPGTAFVSGAGATTTQTTQDPSGIDMGSFLPMSATATGNTGSTIVREPFRDIQAAGNIRVQDNGAVTPGTTIQIDTELFEVLPFGTPATLNQFAIGASGAETATNLKNAIATSQGPLSTKMTATISSSDPNTVVLTASSIYYPGAAGNTLPTAVVPSGFTAAAFSGGLDSGATWSGQGVSGTLTAVVRTSGTDGSNQKESGTASVGATRWSGTAGIAFKGYGSQKTSNWYADNDGIWGEILEQTTGTAGDAPSPTYDTTRNVVSFFGAAADWTTNDAVVYWYNVVDADITAGMWFVMTAWAEYDGSGGSGNISGPLSGVGGGPGTGTSGSAGSSFFISAVTGNYKYTIKAPAIDVDGNGIGGELGETWADFGWSTTSPTTSFISMEGYFFNPDKFLIPTRTGFTSAPGFKQSYTTETGVFTPKVGDFVYYESEVSGVTHRTSTSIAAIDTNLKITLTDTGGTNGSGDFIFGRRNSNPSVADHPRQKTAVKYTLVRNVSTAQTRFFVSSATSSVNLASKGIRPGDLLHITSSSANDGWYVIQSINSDGELIINSSASGNAPDNTTFKTAFSYPEKVNWEIVAADYQQRVTDASATFLTNSVSTGDTIVISSGGFAGNYNIAAVEGETSLLVTATNPSYKGGPFTSAGTPTYYVPTNDILGGVANKFFTSPASYFYGSVFAGDILTVGGSDFTVSSVSSSDTLELTSNFSSYFSGQTFSIRKGLADSGTYVGQETTNKFVVALAANAGLSNLKNIGGIEVGAQIDVDTTSGTDLRDGHLKIKNGSTPGTYPIESVSAAAGFQQTIFLDVELPVSATSLNWEVLAGLTDNEFTDSGTVDRFLFASTSTSAFFAHPPTAGDTLVISPGEASERRVAIQSIASATRMVLEESLDQGLTALRYGILPAEYPQIGDELLVGENRTKITDVTITTGGSVEASILRLENPVPISLGTASSYYVVSAGGDPNTSFIEDLAPVVSHDDTLTLTNGFRTAALGDLVGDRVQISAGSSTIESTIARVVSNTVVELSRPITTVAGEVSYRILTDTQGRSKTLSYPASLSESLLPTDQLTIWQVTGIGSSLTKELATTTSGQSITKIHFSPQIDSGLSSLDFVVTRGGGSGYGRYLLMLNKLAALSTRLDAYKFSDLNLRLGEVLSKHGTDNTSIRVSNPLIALAATAPDDGDGDSLTNRFDLSSSSTQTLEGIKVGDRISITYTNDVTGTTETRVCWVTLSDTQIQSSPVATYDGLVDGFTAGTTRCAVVPEIPVTSSTLRITEWEIKRNSISFALHEAMRLRLLAEEIRQIAAYYTVDTSEQVDSALQLLRQEGYDRMADLLTSGQYAEFFATTHEDGSYQDSMRKIMRDIGNLKLELMNG